MTTLYAKVIEGTSTIQCVCPKCDYGKGYNEPFIAVSHIKKEVECKTCFTKFISLVSSDKI